MIISEKEYQRKKRMAKVREFMFEMFWTSVFAVAVVWMTLEGMSV